LGTGVSWWQGVADQGDPGTVLGMADGARQNDDRDGRVALQRFAGFVRNVMVDRNGLSAEVTTGTHSRRIQDLQNPAASRRRTNPLA
jgi:hypothetical protein